MLFDGFEKSKLNQVVLAYAQNKLDEYKTICFEESKSSPNIF